MAAKFTWKRSQVLSRKRAAAFDESEQVNHDPLDEPYESDWAILKKRVTTLPILEDTRTKSKRLKGEGIFLAEQERYKQSTDTFKHNNEKYL